MGIKGLATVVVTLGAYRRISDSYSRIRKEIKLSPNTFSSTNPLKDFLLASFVNHGIKGDIRIDLSEGKWRRIKTVGDHNS
jgi:hypothetical protein